MQNELIRIEKRDGIETVNARELHAFLESRTRFNDWIAERIRKFQFIEGQDFTTFTEKKVKGRPAIGFYITIDMAKELSMVENNAKGREARQYFIRMERLAKEQVARQEIHPELSEAEKVLEAIEIQRKRIKELSVKAQVAEMLAETEGLYLPSIAGKMIMGKPNIFCQWLVDNKIMYRKGKSETLVPYSPYDQKERGYFEIKMSQFGNHSTHQTYFTARGMLWIQAKYLKKNNMLALDYVKE